MINRRQGRSSLSLWRRFIASVSARRWVSNTRLARTWPARCLWMAVVILGSTAFGRAEDKPLKVLVIGGPGGSSGSLQDAALSELLSRAYGWETRHSQFYAKDDVPFIRGLGTVEDVK